MKLATYFLISFTGASFDGSGDNEEAAQVNPDNEDAPVMLQHRSGMFGSPFASIFADLAQDENEEEVADEGGDEYEGDLEGFDIDAFADSEAVIKVQNAVMLASGFQRGASGAFGNINAGPNAPGVQQSVANRVEVLMKMIMYLQIDPSFDKFFQYGCYCFPDGTNQVLGGYGEARDGADLICKKYHNCQRCIDKDHVDCPEWAPYKYKGRIDKATGKKYLQCLNKPNSCRRNHCECDKRLAEQLAEYELAWNPEYSMAFGGFDRAKSCPAVDKRTNTNNDNTHECCGDYPERFPYISESESGALRKCCVDKTYDPRVLACCQDGILKQHGTCGI